MSGLAERVSANIRRHTMFTTGQRVGVAVSGGADSVCLLHLLREIAPQLNLHLSVVHIEHGIRGHASELDAEFVRGMATGFGLHLHLIAVDVPALKDNLEQAARQVRHDFYRELIASGELDRIATGHTSSDQAETVLYRILRGSGLAGIAGIRPITTGGLVRPLLGVWRPEVEAWLRERSIAWREDDSNHDLMFTRNRLRHEVLPMLRDAFNPNLDKILAHMAILALDDEAYWRQLIGEPNGLLEGPVVLSAQTLALEPSAIARRRIRRAIERVKGNLRQIDFSHVELVLEIARTESGHGRVQLPGIDVFRSFDWIRIAPASLENRAKTGFQFTVSVPGSITLDPSGPIVTFELIEPERDRGSYDKVEDELDWQRLLSVSAPEARGKSSARSCLLELRNWRPGDQYRPIGQSRQKIKSLFQESRIPFWERHDWPVVTCEGEIVWARRFGPAADFAALSGSNPVLRICESPPGK